jgi:hypothetical protein
LIHRKYTYFLQNRQEIGYLTYVDKLLVRYTAFKEETANMIYALDYMRCYVAEKELLSEHKRAAAGYSALHFSIRYRGAMSTE